MNLATLLAEREIHTKLVQFSRAMDAHDWSALNAITHVDMTASLGMGEIQGRAAIVDFIRSFLDSCGPTQHLLGSILIEVDGDKARSRAYVSDMHIGKGSKQDLSFRTLGDYHDEWEKIDDNWLMTRRLKINHATLGSMDVFE